MDSYTLSLPGELLAIVRSLSRTDARLTEAITQMLEEPRLLEQYLTRPSRQEDTKKWHDASQPANI
jgi:hypothetical protein